MLFLSGLTLFCSYANAAGTAVGTVISNVVTLNYDVETVPQPPVTSNTESFVVDNKINLAVTTLDTAEIGVGVGQTGAVTTFSVNNLSNSVQDYALTSTITGITNPFTGGADVFDPVAGSCKIYVESGATPGYQAGQDLSTFIDELAPDTSKTVYLVCDIPNTAATNQVSAVAIQATTRAGGGLGALGGTLTQSTGVNNAVAGNPIDVVFADAQAPVAGVAGDILRDAAASAASAYKIGLSVVLTKSIICTPTPSCLTAFKPNDTVTYQIAVSISGVGIASSLLVSDPIPANLTYVSNSIKVNSAARTDATDADNADFTTNTVNVNLGNVVSPKNFVIEFKATVN